jgi:hypothetical protein
MITGNIPMLPIVLTVTIMHTTFPLAAAFSVRAHNSQSCLTLVKLACVNKPPKQHKGKQDKRRVRVRDKTDT